MRLRYGAILAVLLGTVCSVPAVDPIPPATDSPVSTTVRTHMQAGDVVDVPAGGYADLTIDVPAGASVIWRFSSTPIQRSNNLPPGRVIFAGNGKVVLTSIVIDFNKKTVVDADYTINFGPPKPDPGPEPDPNPDPKPIPGTISSFVVVEDTLKAGPWRGDILGSPKVEAFYRQLRGNRTGLIHTIVDVNSQGDSPTAKRFAPLASGKQLPYLFLLDQAGKVLKECPAPINTPEAFIAAFETHKDVPRAMGLIVGKPKLKWTEFGTTPNTPIIPRSQWKEMRLSAFLPPVYDQDGRGQCASSACCTAIETAAYLQGVPFPKLSAGDLYSRVNGGRDSGSMLEDNLAEAIKNGVAPASMVPYVWDGRRHNDAATVEARKKYRIAEAYWCPSFDAMASALQQGFVVEHGLMWANNYRPDSEGWLPNGGRGGGGHALCGYGIAKRGNTWGIVTRNSWSASWGMAGDCIIPESCFDGDIGGYFAIRVVTTPQAKAVPRPLDPFRSEFALAP